jgi:hypothetical protein
MRLSKGRKAFSRKSKGGAKGLWVPPSRMRVLGPEAVSKAGRIVWRTRVVLPAVPMEKV